AGASARSGVAPTNAMKNGSNLAFMSRGVCFLFQRIDVQTAEENFRAFGLDQDFANVRNGIGAFQSSVAVDADAQPIAIAKDLHPIPFAAWLFDFVRAAEALF